MKSIAFIDTEIEPKNGRILDIGSVKSDGNTFHSPSVAGFVNFLYSTEYVCGHTVFNICCRNARGQAVVKFSKQYFKQIELMGQKNYVPSKAKIRFIVYWKKENTDNEVRIILPDIYFTRME